MNVTSQESAKHIPEDVRLEAAVWIARLHAPDRTPDTADGLRRWLRENEVHQRAFELANELWETAGRIPDHALPRVMRWPVDGEPHGGRAPPRSRRPLWIVSFATLMVAAITGWLVLRDQVVQTVVGERRTVTLEDGSRISLNTATRLSLHFDHGIRRVRLQAGEALFEVARDASRPFVVESGGREVRALGTSFIVRREAGQLAVILMEGKVRVAPTTGSRSDGSDTRTFQVTGQQSGSGRADSVMADAAASIVLVPGQRLMVADSADEATVDRPRLEPLTAWQRGLVALDYTPLSEAISEMNRYSDVKLVIDDPRIGSARISGVFRAGDSSSFALAVAKTHGLRLVEQGRQITLSTQKR